MTATTPSPPGRRLDRALYAEDCEFADPFVSFRGTQRFEDNLRNLAGGFIVDSSCRTLSTSRADADADAPSYTTRLMVKLQLGLPWRPVLGWPWGVEHVFDAESGLIVRHIERWEVRRHRPTVLWPPRVPSAAFRRPPTRSHRRWCAHRRAQVSPAEGVRQLLKAGPPNGLRQGQTRDGGA